MISLYFQYRIAFFARDVMAAIGDPYTVFTLILQKIVYCIVHQHGRLVTRLQTEKRKFQEPWSLIKQKGRNTLGDELQQQVAETDHSLCAGRASSCSNKLSLRRIAWTSGFVCTGDFLVKICLCNRILSPQQVAQIMSDLIFCDMLRRQRFSQKSSNTHVSARHVIPNCRLVCTDLNWRLRWWLTMIAAHHYIVLFLNQHLISLVYFCRWFQFSSMHPF